MQDCLALGAIFATTDSVAVLQVLEEDRAPLLFSLVFGEGVINDATSVALLRTVQVFLQHNVSRKGILGHYNDLTKVLRCYLPWPFIKNGLEICPLAICRLIVQGSSTHV